MNNNQTSKPKKIMSKKKIIALLIIICMAIVATFYFLGCNKQDFTGEVNLGELNGQASTVKKAPVDGTTPADHNPNDNFYYALGTLIDSGSFVGESNGETVSLGIKQKVKGYRVVNGNEAYKQSLSDGVKKVGVRMFVSGKNYVLRDADKMSSLDDVTWKEAQRVSEDAFIGKYGCVPNGITSYVLTDNTILSSEYLGCEDGIYGFHYELDNTLATPKIRLEMRTMAGTKTLPNFEHAALNVYMDENWQVVKTVTDSTYQVDMMGGVTCNESLTETFTKIGEKTEIPDAEYYRSFVDAEITDAPVEFVPDAVYYLSNGFTDYMTGKPLEISLDVQGALNVKGRAAVELNLDDLSAIKVRALIDELSYGDVTLGDIYVCYENGAVYIEYGDLKAKVSVNEIGAVIEKLAPLIGNKLPDLGSMFSSFDTSKLLDSATLTDVDGIAFVNLPIELGELKADVNLAFKDGETVSFKGITANALGHDVTVLPVENANVPAPTGDYYNLLTLLDIIDSENNITVNASVMGVDALINVNLLNFNVDATVGDLKIKYADKTVYLQYQDLKAKASVDDIPALVEKLKPIISSFTEGKKQQTNALTALIDSFKNLDTKALVSDIVNNLTVVETDGVLTLSTSALGMDLSIDLSVVNGGYTIAAINAGFDKLNVSLAPSAVKPDAIPNDSLNKFNNILSVLDVLDENGEINARLEIMGITADVNVDLTPLSVKGKAELLGNTLYFKYADQKLSLSYLGLNLYVNIDDVPAIINFVKPLVGDKFDIDGMMNSLKNVELDPQEIIKSIAAVKAEDSDDVTLSLDLMGMNIGVVLSPSEGNFNIGKVTVTDGKDLNGTLAFTQKADYSKLDGITKFHNALKLLDLVDADGNINLAASIAATGENSKPINIDLTLNIRSLKLNATAFGANIMLDLKSMKAYAEYSNARVSFDLADIDAVMTKLSPIIKKFAPGFELDLSGFAEKIDVKEILSSVKATESDDKLEIALPIFGVNIALNFNTKDGAFDLTDATIDVDGTTITATPSDKIISDLNASLYYVNLKELVDVFGDAVCNMITADNLTLSLSGKIESNKTDKDGNVTSSDLFEITAGEITLIDMWNNLRFSANVTLNQTTTTYGANAATKTKTHTISVIYANKEGYIDYNGLKIVFNTEKMTETVDILKQIYKNIPELQELINGMMPVDLSSGFEFNKLDLSKVINSLLFENNTLTLDANAASVVSLLPASLPVAISVNADGKLTALVGLMLGKMNITLDVTAAPVALTADEIAAKLAYDKTGTNDSPVSDFSSVNELLKTVSVTSKYRNFSMTAKAGAKGSGILGAIKFNDKVTLNIDIDVADGKTYVALHLVRENVPIVWSDYEGNADLYFDGNTKMFYVRDESTTRKWDWYHYVYSTTTTYTKYTLEQFKSDMSGILLGILHLGDTITNQFPKEGDPSNAEFVIEDFFKKYSYNNKDTFTLNLNLSGLTNKAITDTTVGIIHNTAYELTGLNVKASVIGLLELDAKVTLAELDGNPTGAMQKVLEVGNDANYQPAA